VRDGVRFRVPALNSVESTLAAGQEKGRRVRAGLFSYGGNHIFRYGCPRPNGFLWQDLLSADELRGVCVGCLKRKTA